jgi:5-methylcytosine-specific restriction protein A
VTRIRGHALQRIRRQQFLDQPLCVACLAKGIYTAATVSDHIIALVNGGLEDESNRQSLCVPCHEVKTREDLGQRVKPTIGLDGYPV